MCAAEPVKSIIDNASSLVSYVRLTGLGADCKPQLKKYVDTRWNTVHDLLESVHLNYVTLGKILLAKEEADGRSNVMDKLTSISRTDLEVICEFLKMFKVWTKQLESDLSPTLWIVWPTFISLNRHLADSELDADIVRAMKKIGREYLSLNMSDIEPKMIHKVTTVLNPMLKNIAIATTDERNGIYSYIDNEIRKIPPCEATVSNKKRTLDQDTLDEFMSSSNASGGSQYETDWENYSEEFQRYLNSKLPASNPFQFDLFDWWFKNRHTYEKLFRLFINKAGICASSSPSERSFSTTGIILEARRSCLLPDTVHNLVLARNKYLNFE